MSKMYRQCFCLLTFILLFSKRARTEKLPDNFKKCSQKDVACLKDAIEDSFPKLKDGIPELEVPPLDPLYIGTVTFGSGTQVVSFEQKYKNARLSGISNSKINSLIFDLDKGKISINFTAPMAHLNATYEINGKLLSIPIYGNGEGSIAIVNFNGDLQMDVEMHTRHKKKYLRVTKYSFEILVDRLVFNIKNLFDGNELLSENMNKFLNENWEPIYNDLIADYAKVYGDKLTELINKFFAKVPISEMFLD